MLKKFLWLLGSLVLVYSFIPKASAALSFSDNPEQVQQAVETLQPKVLLQFVDPSPPVTDFHEPDPLGVPAVEDFHTPAADVSGDIFAGGQNSLVSIAVGSAEGTRRPDGGFNQAYAGHIDPGNGVWNQGSFSYQHYSTSPEDADARQLKRLKGQTEVLEQIAASYSMSMTLEEKMNGIDLANQAPAAAIDQGGYVDWLADAKQKGLKGADAILYARTNSYINPKTGRLNAPGLGNNWGRVEQDQARRMGEISEALRVNTK
jgi:hypothetical protein